MSEITDRLADARDGDPSKLAAVFEAVYPELKKVAASRSAAQPPGGRMTTTALVHEAFVKLVRSQGLELGDRRHFFACAAKAMRHILVDQARAAYAAKRRGQMVPMTLAAELGAHEVGPGVDVLDLDWALDELRELRPELHEIVELRFFAGLTVEETAELLGQSQRTVARQWRRARAFLHARLAEGTGAEATDSATGDRGLSDVCGRECESRRDERPPQRPYRDRKTFPGSSRFPPQACATRACAAPASFAARGVDTVIMPHEISSIVESRIDPLHGGDRERGEKLPTGDGCGQRGRGA